MPRMAELAALMQLMAPSLPRQGRRIVAFNGLYLAATLLSVAGLFILLAGLYTWLSVRYPSDVVLLVMGGVMLVGSLLLAAIAAGLARRAEKPVHVNLVQDMAHESSALIKSLVKELDEPIRENPALALGIAALSGYLAAEKMA